MKNSLSFLRAKKEGGKRKKMKEKDCKRIKKEKAKGGVRRVERIRGKKGITLIALVVTIVVLLILAGITISLVFSETGIITKAKLAKEETRGAAVEEARDMWELDKSLTQYVGGSSQSLDELLNNLEEQKTITAEEKAQIKETGSVTIGSRTITFNTARTLVELYDAGELKIGDYVNYQNPTSGSYTSLGSKTGLDEQIADGGDPDQIFNVANNQLNWRVLGKDEATGGIKLIAGSPMKRESNSAFPENPYYYMYGAKGYINAEIELNNICALYKNDLAQTARSVTIEDINQVVGVTVDETGRPSLDESGNYGKTYSYTNQYASPEDYLAGKRSNFSKTSNFYGYMANNPALTTATDRRLYNLLFDNVEYGSGKPYWLASRCVNARSDNALFGLRYVVSDGSDTGVGGYYLFVSRGYENLDGFAVRPVVVLKSDVTEKSIHKIEEQIEERWEYQEPR